MPRPLPPSDLAKIEEIYIDESSQTGHRNLIIGGIVFPHRFSEQFKKDILEARAGKLAAERPNSDELREMGWSEVGKGGFEAYKRVVDAYFDFEAKHIKSSEGTVEFHCSVVVTEVPGRAFSGERGRIAFNDEVFRHCFGVAIYHKTKLFHIHLDRRHSNDREAKEHVASLRKKLRSMLIHIGDGRDNAIRKVKCPHSHEVQALQIADLLIGAVAFRLNRHSDADNANPDKLRLCEYILHRGGASDYIDGERGTFLRKEEGRFQIWPRRKTEAKKYPPPPRKKTTPVTLGDLARDDKLLWVYCSACGRERDVNPSAIPLPPETPVSEVGKHMKCSACGSKKINARLRRDPR